MALRKVPKSSSCLTGHVHIARALESVGFQSWLEKQFFIAAQSVQAVREIRAQLGPIEGTASDGVERSYRPDALVTFKDPALPPVLVEVKYAREVEEKWSEIEPRMSLGLAHARAYGYKFKILTDREIVPDRIQLQNRVFLRRFLEDEIPGDARSYAVQLVGGLDLAVAELAVYLGRLCGGTQKGIRRVWALIAQGNLFVEGGKPLCMASVLKAEPIKCSRSCTGADEFFAALVSDWEVRP